VCSRLLFCLGFDFSRKEQRLPPHDVLNFDPLPPSGDKHLKFDDDFESKEVKAYMEYV